MASSVRLQWWAIILCGVCAGALGATPAGAHDLAGVDVIGRWPHGPAQAVANAGDLLYMGSGARMRVIDISDPVSPTVVGEVWLPGVVEDLAVDEGYAVVALGDDGVRVVNVNVPTAPRVVGAVDTPGNALGIAVADGYVYVADDREGLRVIDLSVPTSPVEIAWVPTPGYA